MKYHYSSKYKQPVHFKTFRGSSPVLKLLTEQVTNMEKPMSIKTKQPCLNERDSHHSWDFPDNRLADKESDAFNCTWFCLFELDIW